jgi:Helix-turn-helix domain
MDHSAATQRAIILGYLQRGMHLTTRYARTHLDIMNPSARVGELRLEGHDIIAHKRNVDGHNNVAEYVLLSNTKPQ